ncbi:hypothetical protein B0H16DRAFT_1415855 [Mycena metata]|uniref:Uncharacterized protein n=1 Tax=Mycena metata TaxID=1033252 RepID=A0AAD7NGU5_9AGAR|nr:hypothetical protein B0H16DRAFT_1415855 [Mycena metata]
MIRKGRSPRIEEAVFHLLEYGTEFRVCIRAHSVRGHHPSPARSLRHPGLSFRPEGWRPTIADYVGYEGVIAEFFDSPRGRAALFAGGIVGRLARPYISLDVASPGPSTEVFITGTQWWDGKSPTAYWDDVLTEDEVGFVCGVYKVGAGRINKATGQPQTEHLSWWPKPHAFSSSGMNTGWWSADCERWFRQRLSQIKAGNATLRTQREWKSNLRFYAQPRKIAAGNELICAEFLERTLRQK